jgi:hypothetical protein
VHQDAEMQQHRRTVRRSVLCAVRVVSNTQYVVKAGDWFFPKFPVFLVVDDIDAKQYGHLVIALL